MPQDIYHYSIIEIFYKIGEEQGFIPIKELALINLVKENTDERVDLAWIDPQKKKVEYVFEFETTKQNAKKTRLKLQKLGDDIKKYIFEVKKSMNFEEINTLYQTDEDSLFFLKNLSSRGIKVHFLGEEIGKVYFKK
jgi:hypothetical protein